MKKLYSGLICVISLCTAASLILLSGCTGSEIAAPQTTTTSGTGTARIDVRVGKVGVLAKKAAIEMELCIMKISVSSNDSVIIIDTSDLSGHGENIVGKTFSDLSAPKSYTLDVITVDHGGKAIHSGSVNFTTIPADTVDVSLDLNARYSMLRVSFNTIPDSVDAVSLEIDEDESLDSLFSAGELDTVTLEYDYLAADREGIEYNVSLKASGSFYGTDTVLYAGNTTIVAVSGIDTGYQVTMQWVGPGMPEGATEMTVTIGSVGTTTINTVFNEMGGLSDLVDDLEDGDGLTRYNTYWWTYSDKDFGGNSEVVPINSTPENPFVPVNGGALNSLYSASIVYELDEGDYENGAYAGMGFDLDHITGIDISSSTGIWFYFKGSAARVRIQTANVTDHGCWGYDIIASEEWKLVDLTWSQFNQPEWAEDVPFDLTSTQWITFEVNGETGDTGTIWVDDIHLPGFLR